MTAKLSIVSAAENSTKLQPPENSADLHQWARFYALKGWKVFPVHLNAKTPTCPNGFKDATTNLARIDEWWGFADFNIGFCPENAGMCVVDEDNLRTLSLRSPHRTSCHRRSHSSLTRRP
jgi:hypothetical protein